MKWLVRPVAFNNGDIKFIKHQYTEGQGKKIIKEKIKTYRLKAKEKLKELFKEKRETSANIIMIWNIVYNPINRLSLE